ncbi:hypothetical protein L210DRAFT_3443358 [Boletus edulis BED1]|uniref:G-patch domain-containing protein n=1 Tax=Boletus edulis BED1 TaxID=1328754 RepID=A0AAD4C1V7_BOLED|nr:hypothetical protein L210DRAFT_3443358 [Boletus edulis BED1]
MSAESVARWNAIPMTRPEQNEQEQPGASILLKRSRSEQGDNTDDSEDDNVSLVSRTPSPPPPEDAIDIDKYDEYILHPPREVITVETKIKSTNKGFAMLAKLGWSEGQPLGLSGDGRVDPIPFQIKNDLTGLGKINQDVRMIETTVSQRRELDSERQRKETQDQRKAREDIVAKRAAVKLEITDTLKAFYCTLCEKQFQNVAQYDEHTNSYAHHHKARLRDMQANARLVNQEELEMRKEKERKREEKELRKLARAQGIKMAKPAATAFAPVLTPENDTGSTNEPKPSGFKKAGWAAVTAVPDTNSKRSGWAASSAPPLPTHLPPPPPPPDNPTSAAPPALRSLPASGAPMFRTGGWTSLDSDSSQYVPPPLSPPAPSVSPPPPPEDPPPPAFPQNHRESHAPHPPANALPSQTFPPSSLRALLPPPPVAPAKSGWQQWKQGNNSRRK